MLKAELTKLLPELIKVLPAVLWCIFAFVVFLLLYRRIRDDLLPHVQGLKGMGVELSFVRESMNAAVELAEKSPLWKVQVASIDRDLVLKRAKSHLAVLQNSQILWMDDHPENNLNERKMFRQLKIDIDIAKSTEEALGMLRIGRYDLILSDMAHDDDPTAGLSLLRQIPSERKAPVIFYVGVVDASKGVPARAFGITNRPDELLHLTLDALERKKS
jgi:CheY-like chemotaxis protein